LGIYVVLVETLSPPERAFHTRVGEHDYSLGEPSGDSVSGLCICEEVAFIGETSGESVVERAEGEAMGEAGESENPAWSMSMDEDGLCTVRPVLFNGTLSPSAPSILMLRPPSVVLTVL